MNKKNQYLAFFIFASMWMGLLNLSSCTQESFSEGKYRFAQQDNKFIISNDELTYSITPYSSSIIQVTVGKDTATSYVTTDMTIIKPQTDFKISVAESTDEITIKTEKIAISISKSPFQVKYLDRNGKLLTTMKGLSVTDGKQKAHFTSDSLEAFYGLGQKSISINRRGYRFDTRNQHIGGYSKEYSTMQVNIPYVQSSNNYGVFFDNTYTGTFDLAAANPNEWSYEMDGGDMSFFVVQGDDAQALQTAYYELTGFPTIPPKWTLGLMQSKCGYVDAKEVADVVDTFDSLELPLDAIILDAYWFGGYGDDYPQLMGNFTWYPDHFPNPEAYMADLKSKGIKTITINEPQINVNSDNHAMLAENDWLMRVDNKPFVQSSFWAGSASLLDLSNPAAQDWLWSKQKANVDLGLDAFWVDLTEPDVSDTLGQFYGGAENKIHNIYSFLFAQTLYQGFKSDFPSKRLFNITRAGTAGMQRFGAVHWSGDAAKDFAALKYQIPMLIGASMSGMPHYSSDIGGFTNAWDRLTVPWNEYTGGPAVTSTELYTRWFQFGVFSPSLRPHSGEGQSCEPFAFDQETLEITSKFLHLRYQMIPYLYTYASKTARSGEQLIKPLFMVFNDTAIDQNAHEYMFGELLVAPVFKDQQRERSLYLPKLEAGQYWFNFWNDKTYESGKNITVDAPLDEIPVFVKSGTILPLGKTKKYVDESVDDSLTIHLYPGASTEFTLYEDDGISTAYLQGNFAETKMSLTQAADNLIFTIEPIAGDYKGKLASRTWQVIFHQVDDPKSVILNGKTLRTSDYQWDAAKKQLTLTTTQPTSEKFVLEVK